MIKIEKMSYRIPNGINILSGIDLVISKGEFKGLLGRNGAGKTTLVDLMMGLRKPSEGSISILGQDPFTSDRSVFSDVSFLTQDNWLKGDISVIEFFNFHSCFYPNYSLSYQNELADLFSLDVKAKIGGLSTGQKRRVQIIAALAVRPKILLIDEITAVLDPDARRIFFKLLKDINRTQSTTILLATNIVEDLTGVVDEVLFIQNAKMSLHAQSEIDSLFMGGDE